MPRATDFSRRLILARMVRLGATASEIARQLDLPLSTVRDLTRRVLQAGSESLPVALQPRYQSPRRDPRPTPPLLEAALDLRRLHPRWGAGRIQIELARRHPGATLPAERTLQRWLRQHGLAPAPPRTAPSPGPGAGRTPAPDLAGRCRRSEAPGQRPADLLAAGGG